MDKIINHSLDEVCIYPAPVSDVRHRSDVDPFDSTGHLPVFTAPMTSIVSAATADVYEDNFFIPIIPRSKQFTFADLSRHWQAVSLEQFEELTEISPACYANQRVRICVDVANGHMSKLHELCARFKMLAPNAELMVGNIDNPEVMLPLTKAGVDYVRVGIGGGSVCTTSVKTGIHMSHVMFITRLRSLYETWFEKAILTHQDKLPKLIADGGINRHNMIKALALGYDYVMLGREFAHCDEAAGQVILPQRLRRYYGMSTKEASALIGKKVIDYEEGVSELVNVNMTLSEFSKEIELSLRSAMSYLNCFSIESFEAKYGWGIMSEPQLASVNGRKLK